MAKKGFTIIELVILFLIVSIVSIIVMTDLFSSTRAIRLETAKWKIKSDILYAQNLAATQSINHGVVFNPLTNTYSVYRQNTSTIVNNPLSGDVFTVNFNTDPNYKGVVIASTSFGSPTTNQVEFNNFGVPSDGTTTLTVNGTVAISYGASTNTVTVNINTGMVSG